MQPEERDPAYLWDMLQAAREVEDMLAGRDMTAFLGDKVLLRAVERSIEIIGEAARRVTNEYQNSHPQIPWLEIIGQRHIIAHEYGQIDHQLLYKTVKEDISSLITRIEELLPPS